MLHFDNYPELPIKIMRPLSNLEIMEKDTATLECEFSKKNLTPKWLKNTVEIQPSKQGFERYTIEIDNCVHRLIISDAQLDDSQKYSCVLGDKKTAAKLSVKGQL